LPYIKLVVSLLPLIWISPLVLTNDMSCDTEVSYTKPHCCLLGYLDHSSVCNKLWLFSSVTYFENSKIYCAHADSIHYNDPIAIRAASLLS